LLSPSYQPRLRCLSVALVVCVEESGCLRKESAALALALVYDRQIHLSCNGCVYQESAETRPERITKTKTGRQSTVIDSESVQKLLRGSTNRYWLSLQSSWEANPDEPPRICFDQFQFPMVFIAVGIFPIKGN
jgi:hypothetical protein